MRFDPDRALAHARALDYPRPARSEGERRAADDLARRFQQADLDVDRRPTRPSWTLGPLVVVLFGALWLSARRALPLAPRPVPFLLPSLILGCWLGLLAWRAHAAGLSRPSPQIIARPRGKANPPARVILLTRLGTPHARWQSLWDGSFLLIAVAPGLIGLVPRLDGLIRTTPRAGWGLLAGQCLALLLMALGPKGRTARPIRGDNRTGLALLAELARTWPRRIADRAETIFLATPSIGALQPEDLPTPRDEAKPTLVITLDAPGVGHDLRIIGRGPAARLARASAQDLWIPFRSAWLPPRRIKPRAFRLAGWSCIGLCGARNDGPIDPALLAATAQLVTEITLRWARQATASAQGESPARSSQNPG